MPANILYFEQMRRLEALANAPCWQVVSAANMRSEYWAPYEAMLLCARAIVSERYCFTNARVARTELSITCLCHIILLAQLSLTFSPSTHCFERK